jgi:hypothetical protein
LTSPYQVVAGRRTYTVVTDTSTSYRVLATGVVIDEISGRAPRTRMLVLTPGRKDLYVKSVAGGMFCVAGYAQTAFPDLDQTFYQLRISVCAAGYGKASVNALIPQNASFPVSVPVVRVRPVPVRIQGRVVEDTVNRAPIAGARVTVDDDPSPPQPPPGHVAALRTPLKFGHSAGLAVHRRQLGAAGGAKQLAAAAAAGERDLALSDCVGLAAGAVLRIGPDVSVEYAVIENIGPAGGEVTLYGGLMRMREAGCDVVPVVPGAAGPATTLAQEADAGDGTLVLSAALDGDTVEIADPTPGRVEYHALGAVADAQGFYRLDGVGRFRTLRLSASAAGFTQGAATWTINYGRPVNVVDFWLSP